MNQIRLVIQQTKSSKTQSFVRHLSFKTTTSTAKALGKKKKRKYYGLDIKCSLKACVLKDQCPAEALLVKWWNL
jgi:hypothetical protein